MVAAGLKLWALQLAHNNASIRVLIIDCVAKINADRNSRVSLLLRLHGHYCTFVLPGVRIISARLSPNLYQQFIASTPLVLLYMVALFLSTAMRARMKLILLGCHC